jgi:hypothetical protein
MNHIHCQGVYLCVRGSLAYVDLCRDASGKQEEIHAQVHLGRDPGIGDGGRLQIGLGTVLIHDLVLCSIDAGGGNMKHGAASLYAGLRHLERCVVVHLLHQFALFKAARGIGDGGEVHHRLRPG